MALSDAQIDRFSRQIILPQVGGTGQERLLRSSVAIIGGGGVLETVALYLAGAGIGRIALRGDEYVRGAVAALDPEIHVAPADAALRGIDADVLVACNAQLAELADAAASGRPLVAGGADEQRGWLVVADQPGICVSCAARQATAVQPVGASVHDGDAGRLSPAAGVVGSLMAIAVLKLRLGIGAPSRPVWSRFDAADATLTEHAIVPGAACPTCAAARAR